MDTQTELAILMAKNYLNRKIIGTPVKYWSCHEKHPLMILSVTLPKGLGGFSQYRLYPQLHIDVPGHPDDIILVVIENRGPLHVFYATIVTEGDFQEFDPLVFLGTI